MPDFGFNERDTMAAAAYLIAKSDTDYQHPETFKEGDPQKGEKLFLCLHSTKNIFLKLFLIFFNAK